MALFLDSLGLSSLSKNQAEVLNIFSDIERVEGEDYSYKTVSYDSGLNLVARINKEGKDLDIVGVDSHIVNSCSWSAKPVMSLGQTSEIPAVLFSSLDDKKAFIVNLIQAGLVKGSLSEDKAVNLQVCGFPSQMAVYNNRADYEQKSEKPHMSDKTLFPYSFFNLQSDDITEEQRQHYLDTILFNIFSGNVISTKEVKHSEKAEKCFYSTIDTALGYLDIVYSTNIVEKPLVEGNYVVGNVYLSAKLSFK